MLAKKGCQSPLIRTLEPEFHLRQRIIVSVKFFRQVGVSKNRGIFPPKWMVKIMENPIKMDDLGGFTTPIFGSTP